MTDHDRNIRTLVLCFVLAIMALLPLRLVEIDNSSVTSVSQTQVLGEIVQQQQDQVILPNAEIGEEDLLY